MSGLAMIGQAFAQRVLPVGVGRILGYENPVGLGGEPGRESQVATVAAHHLEHKTPLMTQRGRADRIDCLDYAMQRTVRSDRHVRAPEVVVYRADKTDDVETFVLDLLQKRNLFYNKIEIKSKLLT